jgi:hypothetical protein
MALSSAWSATKRFNRVFSRSSSFRRFAWSSRSPPYSRRHRIRLLADPELLADLRCPEAPTEFSLRLPQFRDDLFRAVALAWHCCPPNLAHIPTLGLDRLQGARSEARRALVGRPQWRHRVAPCQRFDQEIQRLAHPRLGLLNIRTPGPGPANPIRRCHALRQLQTPITDRLPGQPRRSRSLPIPPPPTAAACAH